MKKYVQSNKKGLVLVAIAVIIMTMAFVNKENTTARFESVSLSYNLAPILLNNEMEEEPAPAVELTDEEKLEIVFQEHKEEITFVAKTFKIAEETLIDKLRENHQELNLLNLTEPMLKTLINYLFSLEETSKELFDNKITPCQESKEYMISLINLFSHLYGNVDFEIAAAIAEIESGYQAPYMLSKNNIFGGMYSGGLLKYKNIEYGILRYIKMLSESYFGKGLITVEQIGLVYNPTFNENGVKIAKPTWVYNVTNAIDKYLEYQPITNIVDITTSIKAE